MYIFTYIDSKELKIAITRLLVTSGSHLEFSIKKVDKKGNSFFLSPLESI